MPSDGFREMSLGEICQRQGGSLQTGPFGSQLHASDYQDTGTPVVMPTDIVNSRIETDSVARVSDQHVLRLSQHRLRLHDIVFSRRGDVTRFALIREHGVGWLCGTGCLKVRVGSGRLALPEWVAFALETNETKEWLVRHAVGATMPNLNTSILAAVPLRVPSFSRQRETVQVLSAIDHRIELLRQTNITLECVAQSLFKSWFIDFDPVRTNAEGREPEGIDAVTAALFPAEFEESVLGLIPKGWRWSHLGSMCTNAGGWIQTGPFGSQLHASDYVDAGIPVVMPKDMQDRRVSERRITRVSQANADRLSKHKLCVGDIVFSRRGDVGLHATVSEREVGWLCGTGCLLVRPGAKWRSPAFLSQALARPESVEWLARHAVGATMPNLNTGILESLPLLSPSDNVLMAFERIVCVLESRISQNHLQSASLVEVRNLLLPHLISGKLQFPEAQEQIEDALA